MRGLKLGSGIVKSLTKVLSHPVRGAWIEIVYQLYIAVVKVSHPVRGAWIEMYTLKY